MRSIQVIFYVVAAGIFATGCDGADLVQPPSRPALYGSQCPVDPCENKSPDCFYGAITGCPHTPAV